MGGLGPGGFLYLGGSSPLGGIIVFLTLACIGGGCALGARINVAPGAPKGLWIQ